MMNPIDAQQRKQLLQLVVLAVFVVIIGRLAYIQLIDTRYKELAEINALKHIVQYPPRGEIFDRHGDYLVQNRVCYDLMVVTDDLLEKDAQRYREARANGDTLSFRRGFDTLRLCEATGVSIEQVRKVLRNPKQWSRTPRLVANYLSQEQKLRFDEQKFHGFYTVNRTVRLYPHQIGGNLLGYVSEVSQGFLDRHPEYQRGDYVGATGMERAHEELLRGRKGVQIFKKDVGGALQGSYLDGLYDTLPEPGVAITSTIDAKLQLLGEELMRGKVGAAVAIEPSTGEILMMVSSPTYDPDLMVGRERSKNYNSIFTNPREPFFNRAVSARYPPGSTFKLVQGLIGQQEGVLRPSDTHSCNMGYAIGKHKMKCHAHASPLDLRFAVATSCNAYFCYVFRDILDNRRRYSSVKEGYDAWREYVESFGFGHKLGSDFLDEGSGYVPTRAFYDKAYRNQWNSVTILSLSIGQGELGCTPLQLANLACIVANRGYYYIPHIVKHIEGRDSIDARFYERQYTKVEARHFEPIVEGMWRGVNVGGTSTLARLPGLDVCGKTGTAQNPHGRDHSTFLSFAPKDNPRIAISVYVENGGFGASAALPIASLLEEYYLTDTITRPHLVEYVKNLKPDYWYYDRKAK